MIVTVYIDESGTHKGSPLMIMAGFVARFGQWNRFDKKWRQLLKSENLTYVRAKELYHGQREFKGWPINRKIKFINRLENICLRNTMFGFSIRMDNDDYENFYIRRKNLKNAPFDSKYGVCFRCCMSLLPAQIREDMGREDLDISLVIESGHPNVGAVSHIFNQFKTDHDPEIMRLLGTVTIADKKEFAGLQAADVLAYTTYRQERQGAAGLVPFPKGGTVSQARRIMRSRAPLFRLHADRKILTELRDKTLALKPVRRQLQAENAKAQLGDHSEESS